MAPIFTYLAPLGLARQTAGITAATPAFREFYGSSASASIRSVIFADVLLSAGRGYLTKIKEGQKYEMK
jgi:hypothetical protein